MSSSVYFYNKKKDILILNNGPNQDLDNTSLTVEGEYSINFAKQGNIFCLNLNYNGSNSYIFVNRVKRYQFKAKDSELIAYLLCLGNTSNFFYLMI